MSSIVPAACFARYVIDGVQLLQDEVWEKAGRFVLLFYFIGCKGFLQRFSTYRFLPLCSVLHLTIKSYVSIG
jgi:hypothetical protein